MRITFTYSTVCNTATALRKHIAETHELIRQVCDICGTIIVSIHYLKDHMKLKHEQTKDFTCHYCGKAFALKPLLKNHILNSHEQSKRRYNCAKCDFSREDLSLRQFNDF